MDFYIQHLARIKSIFIVVARIDEANAPSTDAKPRKERREARQWPLSPIGLRAGLRPQSTAPADYGPDPRPGGRCSLTPRSRPGAWRGLNRKVDSSFSAWDDKTAGGSF